MAKKQATIAQEFESDHSQRAAILNKARACASLSKPWVLPDEGHTENDDFNDNYQSIGCRGGTHAVGKLLSALFGNLWFNRKLSAEILYNPQIPPQAKQQMSQQLFLQELTAYSVLESSHSGRGRLRKRGGFLSRKRQALEQIVITGDVLEKLSDDNILRVFRRDQYVTQRDSSTDILYHITKEKIDPLSLSDDQRRKAEIDDEKLLDMPARERMGDLYTKVEWQPISKIWVITQEYDGYDIVKSEEAVTPYFATPYDLVPGENYGRGLIEQNYGDLGSLDSLEKSRLEILGEAAKSLSVIDENSNMRPKDLDKPSGSVIHGRVRDGRIQDVAHLAGAHAPDYQMLTHGIDHKTQDLGKAFMLESDTQPQKDRVTRYQAQRIAMELDAGWGGIYTAIADDQQVPLVERLFYNLERDLLIAKVPEDGVTIDTLTGINALKREESANKLMTYTQAVSQLGPQAMQRINIPVLMDVLARYSGIHEPGLIKSDEQVEQEQQQQQQQALLQQAAEKATDTVGNIVENQATKQQ